MQNNIFSIYLLCKYSEFSKKKKKSYRTEHFAQKSAQIQNVPPR